jgi:hypothetical protein
MTLLYNHTTLGSYKTKASQKTEKFFEIQANPTLTLPKGEGIAALSPSPSGRAGVGFADICENSV